MLGASLFRYLSRNVDLEVYGTGRSSRAAALFDPSLRARVIGGTNFDDDAPRALFVSVKPDVAINCIGIVKQAEAIRNKALVVAINAMLPHRLLHSAMISGTRLVQISTDCVFSGRKGSYQQDDVPDPIDFYGKSKLLGEVDKEAAITLRTSIVGHETASETRDLNYDQYFTEGRPEIADTRDYTSHNAAVMLVGLSVERVLAALTILENQRHTRREVRDYAADDVSAKVLRIILSYTDWVNRRV